MGILSWIDWIGLGFVSGEYCVCLSEIQVGGRHQYITRVVLRTRNQPRLLTNKDQTNRGYISAPRRIWAVLTPSTILWDPAMHCTWRRETVFDLLDLFGLFGLFVSGFFSDPNGREIPTATATDNRLPDNGIRSPRHRRNSLQAHAVSSLLNRTTYHPTTRRNDGRTD
jgi:hypothetical protein